MEQKPPQPQPTPEQVERARNLSLSDKVHAAAELLAMGLGLLSQVRTQLQAGGIIGPPTPIVPFVPPAQPPIAGTVEVNDLDPERFKKRLMEQLPAPAKQPPPSQAPDNPDMAPKLIGRALSVVNEPGQYPKLKTDVLCNCKSGYYIFQEALVPNLAPFRYGMQGEPGHLLLLESNKWVNCPVSTGLVRIEDGFGAQQVRLITSITMNNTGVHSFWNIYVTETAA